MKRKKISDSIQRFGRTLLLPIGVLAPVGMILGISGALVQDYMIEKFPFLGHDAVNEALTSIQTISSVVFDKIPLLFAMGVAYGLTKNNKGNSVFDSTSFNLIFIDIMIVFLSMI